MEPAQSSPSPLIPSEVEESVISDGEFLDLDRNERKHLPFDQGKINSSGSGGYPNRCCWRVDQAN